MTNAAVLCCLVAALVGSAGCQSSSTASGAQICPPDQRVTLLSSTIERITPSEAFTVPARARAWVATTANRDSGDLSAGLGGAVATISVFRAVGSPKIMIDANGFRNPGDPTVGLNKPDQWFRLPVSAGRWRIYTVSLGVTPLPVAVVSCPG